MNELLSVANLARGGILEQFDTEMIKVLENIQDPNTAAETKRKMTITVIFEPTDNRLESSMKIETKLALAPTNSITTRIYMDKDNDGNILAGEMVKGQYPGQGSIDFETGEVQDNKIFKVK